MVLTLEQAIKLFGKEYIPPGVFTDPWEQKRWLEIKEDSIKEKGLKKVLASKATDCYSWEYVKTLIPY